jgi:hypothetical protein
MRLGQVVRQLDGNSLLACPQHLQLAEPDMKGRRAERFHAMFVDMSNDDNVDGPR